MNNFLKEDIFKGKVILMVDDMPQNLLLLRNILKLHDIKVITATNGAEGLAFALSENPDLILLDIQMPEMDGYQVCEKLKSNSKTQEIPIIFLSGGSKKDEIIKGLQMGAVDYITKPFNTNELMARVYTQLELKYSKDLISRQNEELKALNAMKDKFFSTIAHDLKNPLSSVLGFSEILSSSVDSSDWDSIKEMADYINKSAISAYNILENLLLWSRSQTNRIQIIFQPTLLSLIIDECFNSLSGQALNKSVTLLSKIDKEIMVNVDLNLTTTVVRNLISNAIKFSYPGRSVDVNSSERNGQVVVSVNDSGVGIKPDNIKKLFRIDLSHSTPGTNNEKGTGIGLILCKEFIDKQGGKIWVESSTDSGTTFYFTLQKYSEQTK
jgi:two-component system, sensor histidine kinase and response regulator